MNKFEAINKVLVSHLGPEDKCLLVELVTRADDSWKCWPSVERLCKVRGIKHEKNFKGADHYLPGIVTKVKKGRKNVYYINTAAIDSLSEGDVTIKHTNTPAQEGAYTPAVEGVLNADTPAVADNTPAVEGANTTSNTSKEDTTEDTTPDGAITSSSNLIREVAVPFNLETLTFFDGATYAIGLDGVSKEDSSLADTPATEGVSEYEDYSPRDWREAKSRGLTADEASFLDARRKSYLAKQAAAEKKPVLVGDPW